MAVLAGFGWNGLRQLMDREARVERAPGHSSCVRCRPLAEPAAAGYAVYRHGAVEAIAHSFEVSASLFWHRRRTGRPLRPAVEALLPRTALASLVLFTGFLRSALLYPEEQALDESESLRAWPC